MKEITVRVTTRPSKSKKKINAKFKVESKRELEKVLLELIDYSVRNETNRRIIKEADEVTKRNLHIAICQTKIIKSNLSKVLKKAILKTLKSFIRKNKTVQSKRSKAWYIHQCELKALKKIK